MAVISVQKGGVSTSIWFPIVALLCASSEVVYSFVPTRSYVVTTPPQSCNDLDFVIVKSRTRHIRRRQQHHQQQRRRDYQLKTLNRLYNQNTDDEMTTPDSETYYTIGRAYDDETTTTSNNSRDNNNAVVGNKELQQKQKLQKTFQQQTPSSSVMFNDNNNDDIKTTIGNRRRRQQQQEDDSSSLDNLTPPTINWSRDSILFSDNPSTKSKSRNELLTFWRGIKKIVPPIITGAWPWRDTTVADDNPLGAIYNIAFVRMPVIGIGLVYSKNLLEGHPLVMDVGQGEFIMNPLIVFGTLAFILA